MSDAWPTQGTGPTHQPVLDAATIARRPLAVLLDVALLGPMMPALLGLLSWGALGLLYATAPLWTEVPGAAGDQAGAYWLAASGVALNVSLAAAVVPMVAYVRWVARAHQGLTDLRSPGMRLADIPAAPAAAAVVASEPMLSSPDAGKPGGRAVLARLTDVLLAFAAVGWPLFATSAAVETALNGLGVQGTYTVSAPAGMLVVLAAGIGGFALAWTSWVRLIRLRHRGADGGTTIGCRVADIRVMPDGAVAQQTQGGALALWALRAAVVLLIASSALPCVALAGFVGASMR